MSLDGLVGGRVDHQLAAGSQAQKTPKTKVRKVHTVPKVPSAG
jgi:hypothetical protein